MHLVGRRLSCWCQDKHKAHKQTRGALNEWRCEAEMKQYEKASSGYKPHRPPVLILFHSFELKLLGLLLRSRLLG